MRIAVFGIGYVGTVTCACLAALGHDIVAVDVNPEKVSLINRGWSPIVEPRIDQLIAEGVAGGRLCATGDAATAIDGSEASFVCIGTPAGAQGAASLAAVERVLGAIGERLGRSGAPRGHCVLLRSTVPPGTAEELAIPLLEARSGRRQGEGFHFYSNPEFLRQGEAVRDFNAPPFVLIGAACGDEAALPRALFAPLDAPLHVTTFGIAEATKYLSNTFHAVKLAFANEAGRILAAQQIDVRETFRLFGDDRNLNISTAYLRPGFAFGGSCLPKDLRAFLALAAERDVDAPLLQAVLPSNEAVVEHSLRAIEREPPQRLALFGLAFKPGTDDLRESPYLRLGRRLIEKGYDLRVFDRALRLERLIGDNRAFAEREIPDLADRLAGSPAEALAGSRLVVVGHLAAAADLAELRGRLGGHKVFDLAGIPVLARQAGIDYWGVCW